MKKKWSCHFLVENMWYVPFIFLLISLQNERIAIFKAFFQIYFCILKPRSNDSKNYDVRSLF